MSLALTLCVDAAASDLFDGLAPTQMGAELTAVLEEAELACMHDERDAGARRCHPLPGALDALFGIALRQVEAVFVDERLALVTAYFDERRFVDMTRALTKRLGDGEEWTIVLRAGMAGQFTDEIRIWDTARYVLVAQQFDSKIDRSSIVYGTQEAMAPLLRKIKASPPGSLRDL